MSQDLLAMARGDGDAAAGGGSDLFEMAGFRPQPKKPAERTWGEAATDTVVQLAEGVNNIAGAVPNLFAPQSGVASFFRDNADHWRGEQSEALRRKVADADAQIAQANQDSIVDQAVAAAKAYSSDPALAARFVTTNLPSMLPGVAAAKAAQVARLAGGASAAVAAGTATTAAGVTNAVLNAGGARGEAFEDIRDALVKKGHSREEAERMALERSRIPAAVGAATGFLSGKIGLEHAVVGGGGARGGLAAGARSVAAELLGEQAEEVLPQVATNYQASDIDQRPLSRNVGRTAVETAIGSAPGAGVSGAMTALRRGDAAAAKTEEGTPPAEAGTPAEDMLPDSLPDQPARRSGPAADAADTAAAVTRLAELEVIDGSVGLSEEQKVERAVLAERVERAAAREEELEAIGETPEEAAGAAAPRPEAAPAAEAAQPGDASAAGASQDGSQLQQELRAVAQRSSGDTRRNAVELLARLEGGGMPAHVQRFVEREAAELVATAQAAPAEAAGAAPGAAAAPTAPDRLTPQERQEFERAYRRPVADPLGELQDRVRAGSAYTQAGDVQQLRDQLEDAWLELNVATETQQPAAAPAQIDGEAIHRVDAQLRTRRIRDALQNLLDEDVGNTVQIVGRLDGALEKIGEPGLDDGERQAVRRVADAYFGFRGARERSPLPKPVERAEDWGADNSSMEALIQERGAPRARSRDRSGYAPAAESARSTAAAPAVDAFDPGAVRAKTWPQFVAERGENVARLRRGSPAWDRLQNEWAAVKTKRAGTNPEGTGAVGAATPEIQNRDRARPASVVQMQGMAQSPDYMRLGPSRSPETGAPMVFAVGDQVHAAHAIGRGDTAVMSDGQRVPFQYAVMEAGDVQPSNFADGGVNPLFDAAHPGTVKALNNGRTAGLRAAYERGTADSYRQELMADSAMHGIDPQVIAGMRAPMLVRLYSERDNQANMGAKSQSQALGLSAAEQAATDAALLDTGVLDVLEAGDLAGAANRDFARAFVGKLQAEGQDVAGMLDAGGALSPAGVVRLQAALVHRAYSDGDLVESMFGSTDNDIRAIGEALKDVAGEWANLRQAAAAGAVNPQVDVTGNLLQAIRLVQKARRERASLYDAINQVDMVTGDVPDPMTVGVLRMLYSGQYLTRAVGRDRLADSLREYMAAALATRAGGDMFGEQVGPDAILSALSGQPTTQTTNAASPQPSGQSAPAAPQGERGAPGRDPAGRGADEPGQQARRPEPDRAGPRPDEDGGRGEGQDAQDPRGQPDGQGDRGAAEDGRGAVAPDLELSSYTPREVTAREDAQQESAQARAKADAKADADARAERERREVSARMEASAENFELGEDADDALSGQRPMFSRAAAPESEAFKKWFGDSKVTESGKPGGRPLVMYRGSPNENAAPSRPGALIFLSPDPAFAEHYAAGGATYPLYVKAERPFDASRGEGLALWRKYAEETGAASWATSGTERGALPVWQQEPELRKWLDRAGVQYDGIWFAESNGGASLAVLAQAQVKSATGNIGTFDPSNPDIRFSFAGRNARSADLGELERAEAMARSGMSSAVIQQETGWHRGVDGRWRFEISDDTAEFRRAETRPEDLVEVERQVREAATVTQDDELHTAQLDEGDGVLRAYSTTREGALANLVDRVARARFGVEFDIAKVKDGQVEALTDVLRHPALFAAYPFLRGLKVYFRRGRDAREFGSYDETHRAVTLNADRAPGEVLSTLLHELQHAIQYREGFALGGNMDADFTSSVRKTLREMAEGEARAVEAWKAKHPDLMENAEKAAAVVRDALMYESMERLLSYSERDKPSGVFRLIRNEMQWIYNTTHWLDPVAVELQRRFYGMPKSGAKRNAYIRDMAFDAQKWLRSTIAPENLAAFKADERTMKGMIGALRRHADKARAALEPLREQEGRARVAEALERKFEFGSPYDIYRSLAGEVEARTTQARQGLTEAERRARPVQADMDVSPAEAIVVVGGHEMRLPDVQQDRGAPGPADDFDVDAFLRTMQEAPAVPDEAKAQAVARTESAAAAIRSAWANGPEVVVAFDMADPKVPQQVRDADLSQRSRGAGGSPEGFYFGGKVYLLAEQLPRDQDVARVLMHEALGHHGLAGVFGSGLDAVLQQLVQARPAEVRRKAAEYGLDYGDRAQRMQAAEEVLAEMAQARPELGFVQRAVAAVRSWARAHIPGFADLRMTDAEIVRDFILPARGWVERGRQADAAPAAAGGAPALAFSLPADALAQARAKWAGLVDQFVRGGLDETKTYEVLPSSTAVMKMLGLPDLPAHAGVHAMDALYNHGVKPSQMKQILDELANPRMVMVWNKGSRGDASLNFVTSMSNPQGQPFVIAIKPNRGSVKGRFHWVATVTEKQPRAILDMVREGGAMYAGEGAIAGISEAEMREALRFAKEKRGKEARGLMQAIGTSYSLPNLVQRVLYAKDLEAFKGEQAGPAMFSRAPAGAAQAAQPAQGLLARLQDRVRQLTSPEAVDSWLYNWQDKFIDLKRIQDQIKALNGTVSETNDAYRGEELYHKRVAKRTANFLRDEVRPLLAAMNDAKVGMEEFERFLHARHAPEANRVLAERNPSKQELDQKRADAAKTVADLRRQLQHARASGSVISGIQRSLGLAMAEADRWNSAEAFKGTEEDRLSLSGMSDAEAKNVMGGYSPEQRKVMDALATRVDRMNNITLQTLEQYGLMDRLSIEAWRKTYQHYVPLHRDEARPDSKAHPIGQGFSTKGDASKRRTGSNEKVTNILSHLVMQREAALTRGEKNNVMKRLYVLAAQNPDESLWSLELPKKKAIDPDTGLVRTMPDIGARLRDNVLTLRIGGKDKHIIFNERNERAARLALAMKNLDATELDRFTRTMGHLTRWFAAVNTQYNPIFGVLNLARDVQGSLLQLSSTPLAGRQREVFKNIRSNMLDIYRDLRRERRESGAGQGPWARLWEQLQLDGGTTGYRDLYTKPEDRAAALRKALERQGEGGAKAMVRGVGEWLSDFNETLEASTRLATYKAALDAGQSREAAASLAKNITVNFNRKGRNTSVVGSYYAFLNAAIQGNVRMLETLAGPAGRKVMAGGVALGMLSGLAGALIMGGGGADDEWKKIPDFVKERSIIIPLSRQDYVAIPMPLGFHVFPNIGRKLVEFGMHDDPTKSRAGHLADMAMIALNAYNPLGGADNIMQMLAPTPFDPVVALMENKDWTGRQIYKEQRSGLDPKPGHAMGKDSVTPPARWVARLINDATGGNEWQPGKWSPNPDALEYLFGQFTGGVGRELTKAGNMVTAAVTGEELAPHQITLAGRFYGNTRGVNGQSTSYYENLKRVNTSMAEARGRVARGEEAEAVLLDVPLARVDGAASALDKRVSDLVKMRRQIQAGSDPNKRELVKEVNAEIERSMYLLNKAVEDVLAEQRGR
ncbi:hypothetical protein QRO10_06015 [Paracidovorax citrulli]|uniref:Large polyvalent protein associated domain-containing protein n=1 Tax=Paracidovorax citrulli (strain AAC00-1) TaxID=397945 RepID=A1TPS0_PARC0|nr:LPD38 domain-containing protein [Paracidovorax citrulli]ABM32958.1 hypothetical protein Aave_2383 [Paracidovorax citrulli AAC00-1]PVY67178.1 hypothetical protein C8E08_4613 [Paracidovorax citrulli]REG68659.1 hypothetical protein C8E07_1778 [Paracidovorax citrulli]RLJ93214.1 hypothetical protein C8E06_1778 [Paracidovorax citrulli]WIY40497.1 hypothetical protein QRO10_06015 [Paracidovorax citrulli]